MRFHIHLKFPSTHCLISISQMLICHVFILFSSKHFLTSWLISSLSQGLFRNVFFSFQLFGYSSHLSPINIYLILLWLENMLLNLA